MIDDRFSTCNTIGLLFLYYSLDVLVKNKNKQSNIESKLNTFFYGLIKIPQNKSQLH